MLLSGARHRARQHMDTHLLRNDLELLSAETTPTQLTPVLEGAGGGSGAGGGTIPDDNLWALCEARVCVCVCVCGCPINLSLVRERAPQL